LKPQTNATEVTVRSCSRSSSRRRARWSLRCRAKAIGEYPRQRLNAR
jgi:hypothetical protein